MARAAADGHTLLMASPPLAIAPAVYASLPYMPSDLIAIALLGQVPNVLLVHPDSGIASVAVALTFLHVAATLRNEQTALRC